MSPRAAATEDGRPPIPVPTPGKRRKTTPFGAVGGHRIAAAAGCLLAIVLFMTGCAGHRARPKERSCAMAVEILRESRTDNAFDRIKDCRDVDALRIAAFAATAAAWPGEAGPDMEFDDRMDAISRMALDRLFAIDSKEAEESLEYFKRCFPPDGGYGVFFGEREERKRSLGLPH